MIANVQVVHIHVHVSLRIGTLVSLTVMAQPKKQKESLEDVVHERHDGADQAKDKKKRAALFGNSKKKEKLADSQSHLAEEVRSVLKFDCN